MSYYNITTTSTTTTGNNWGNTGYYTVQLPVAAHEHHDCNGNLLQQGDMIIYQWFKYEVFIGIIDCLRSDGLVTIRVLWILGSDMKLSYLKMHYIVIKDSACMKEYATKLVKPVGIDKQAVELYSLIENGLI